MAKRKLGGLGKGLDSLFEDLPMTEDASPDLTRLPVREIEPDPDQPRKNFDEDAMAALAESIGENGLLQPIAVRAKKTGPGYVIIAGERRWRAARMAGLDEVPVLIKDVTDEQAAALALIENLQREDLDPIEVAEGCKKLIERYGLTQEEAAKRLGKSRSAITNAMRLLNLPEYVRDQVRTGDISAGHAKALLSLGSPEQMSAAADQIIAKDMSVRQAEEAVALWREEQRLPWTAASEAAPQRPAPCKRKKLPQIAALQKSLCAALPCKARVSGDMESGRITLRYTSPQELEALLNRLHCHIPEDEPAGEAIAAPVDAKTPRQ